MCVLTVDIFYYAVSKRQPVCWIINSFSKDRGMVGIVTYYILGYVKLLNGQTAWLHAVVKVVCLFLHQ